MIAKQAQDAIISSRSKLRDSWFKNTNISPLAVLVGRQQFSREIQRHLRADAGRGLHERINNRADLWTTEYMARNWGYGKGNHAGRRLYVLWQARKISGEQFYTAAPEIARRTYGIID